MLTLWHRRMFVLLVYAAKPLTVGELCNALAVRPASTNSPSQLDLHPSGELSQALEDLAVRDPDAHELIQGLKKSPLPITAGELLEAIRDSTIDWDWNETSPSSEPLEYEASRAPSPATIESLGGSLIQIEDAGTGDKYDWRIQFVHKSVLDFFKEDPDTLGIRGDRLDLRSFFVSDRQGNLEVGQCCLRYLQLSRYQDKINIGDLKPKNEHAFLRYAAAFWFEHLHDVEHSMALLQEVKSLVESKAFWNCLAVQVETRPHLFARYTQLFGGFFGLGMEGGELSTDDSIMVPLPQWLESYKPDGFNISMAFYSFIKEWHEVLLNETDCLSQCQIDQTFKSYISGLTSLLSRDIRVSTIAIPPNARNVTLSGVAHAKSKLLAQVVYHDDAEVHWQESSVSSKASLTHFSIPNKKDGAVLDDRLYRLRSQSTSSRATSSFWSVSLGNLDIQSHSEENFEKHAPSSCDLRLRQPDPARRWRLVVETDYPERGSVVAMHLTSVPFDDITKQEVDSGYDSASTTSAGAQADTDSDSGWSDSGIDTDEDNEDYQAPKNASEVGNSTQLSSPPTDCLILFDHAGDPIWLPWVESGGSRKRVTCAFHPRLPLAVSSQSLGELKVVNLDSGNITIQVLSEPAFAQATSAIQCKGMADRSLGLHTLLTFSE
jgi:hypothetical protein